MRHGLGAFGLVLTLVALLLLLLSTERSAHADPLRLRGDALVETRSPVGLLVLRGEDRLRPWLDVETVTWLGGGLLHRQDPYAAVDATPTGDVLTLSVRARDVTSGSEIRAGRMVVSMGAIRPVQIDGARGLARVFGGTTVEAFGGVPVIRRFEQYTSSPSSSAVASFDWTAGGRLGQVIGGDVAAVGGSYVLRRRGSPGAGIDDEEVGADLALTPSPWLTAAGRASFDLLTRGPTDVLASVSVQDQDLRGAAQDAATRSPKRLEIFTTHRSPGRLLPSTSLFSVLGDFAATSVGTTLRWRAFPRLELIATGSVQTIAGEVGGQALGRTTLALDDEWASSVGFEARRVDFNGAKWTGVRSVLLLPLRGGLRAATEIELVVPDDPRGRGSLWPWALGALGWSPPPSSWASSWEVAGAVEGSSGPEYKSAVAVLARLSYAFERSPAAGSPR